ncbi:hypothetical protein [Nocardia sp. NPDC002869]|uniref:hypothetical protein n=1 Tax=Nocardia sp. NPDC002869 TaxID=3161032 RepID=UPI00398D602E
MGGWTGVVVAFGIASTVALVIQQRAPELALIRSGGPWWMFPAIIAGSFSLALAATASTGFRATHMRPLAALTTP